MLTLKNITIKDLKNHILIEDFTYSLGNTDKVGIIGEEGNGKSTLLQAIYNKKRIEDYAVMSGEIDTDFKHIGYFEQQLSQEWNASFVYEYILKNKPDDEIEMEQYNELQHYETLCGSLNLSTQILHGEQNIASLSGGEKVKIQLLKLLGKKMDLLLLDEPTNDLDIDTLNWLEDFILRLNIPIMFISHDETLLNKAANVIVHIEQLNKKSKSRITVFRGTYDAYVTQRQLKLGKDIQVARKEKQEYMKKKVKLNDIQNAVHDALNDCVRIPRQAALLAKKMRNIKAQEKRFDKEGYSKVDSVEEAIDVYFDSTPLHSDKIILNACLPELRIGKRVLVHDVDLFVKGQDKSVIIGPNGCGKSILMKYIYQNLCKRDDLKLGYMPQSYADEFEDGDTPVQFLLESGDKQDVARAGELLGRMKFTTDEMEHTICELSEGQKAKLYLLKFIKTGCNVLLLDEPTRNLSPLTNPVIRGIIQDFQGCVLAVSHDRKFIDEVFTTIYEIKDMRWLVHKT